MYLICKESMYYASVESIYYVCVESMYFVCVEYMYCFFFKFGDGDGPNLRTPKSKKSRC